MTTTLEPNVSAATDFSIQISRRELLDALRIVAAGAGRSAINPVLGCVLLDVGKDGLKLETTNMEMRMTTTCRQVQTHAPGKAVTDCADLLDLLKAMDDETVGVRVEDDKLVVVGDSSTARRPVLNPDAFPPAGEFKADSSITLPAETLRRFFARTSFAVSAGESRYVLTGVYIECGRDHFAAVASDGRRMAIAERGEHRKGDSHAILPMSAVKAVMRCFEDCDVTIGIGPARVRFSSESASVSTNIIEGIFPPFRDVTPKAGGMNARLTCDRESLIAAARQAALVCTPDKLAAAFALSDRGADVALKTDRGEAGVRVPGKYEGKEMTIGLNTQFLIDGLSALEGPEVTIHFDAPNRPILIQRDEYTYVLMPSNLQ